MKTYLVTFVYTDNCQSFIEHVAMTYRESQTLRRALAPAEKVGKIADLYIGPLQINPTPFTKFFPEVLSALGLTARRTPAT